MVFVSACEWYSKFVNGIVWAHRNVNACLPGEETCAISSMITSNTSTQRRLQTNHWFFSTSSPIASWTDRNQNIAFIFATTLHKIPHSPPQSKCCSYSKYTQGLLRSLHGVWSFGLVYMPALRKEKGRHRWYLCLAYSRDTFRMQLLLQQSFVFRLSYATSPVAILRASTSCSSVARSWQRCMRRTPNGRMGGWAVLLEDGSVSWWSVPWSSPLRFTTE